MNYLIQELHTKSKWIILFIIIHGFLIVETCSQTSRELFIDSNQKLGNSSSFSVLLFDVDQDSDLDALVQNWHPQTSQENTIWLNDGHGKFVLGKEVYSVGVPRMIEDIDLNQMPDLVANNKIWLNNGDNNYIAGPELPDTVVLDILFGDLNNDNLPDCILNANHVLLNTGDRFIKQFELGGWLTDRPALIDVEKDNDLDIYVAHNHNPPPPPFNPVSDKLWINDGEGNFTLSDQEFVKDYSTSVAIGDLNNDNYDDIFVTGGANTIRVYINNKNGSFTEKPQKIGFYDSMKAALADFDDDGDLDVFIVNGKPMGPGQPNLVLLNDGQGTFIDSGLRLGNDMSSSVALGDLDGDGDIDAFVSNVNLSAGGAYNRIYINTIR